MNVEKLDFVAIPSRDADKTAKFYGGETIDTGVCHIALFRDPDGNDLMLHGRYKPYE